MSSLDSSAVAPVPPSAASTTDGAPDSPDTDTWADSQECIDLPEYGSKIYIVRPVRKSPTLNIDPLKYTAGDLIFGDSPGPVFKVVEDMVTNGYLGPIFVCPKALYNNGGRLRGIPRFFTSRTTQMLQDTKKTSLTPWEHACELLRKHRVPDPRRLDANGNWPRLRPASASAGDVDEVWVLPYEWAKTMFLVGWALENPRDGNRRWFYRNPDIACLKGLVQETVALPSMFHVPTPGVIQLFVPPQPPQPQPAATS